MKINQSYIFAVGLYFIVLLINILSVNQSYIALIQPIIGILVTSFALVANKMCSDYMKKIGNKMISLSLISILSFQDVCEKHNIAYLQFIFFGMMYQRIITTKKNQTKEKLMQRILMSVYGFSILSFGQFLYSKDKEYIQIIYNQLIFLQFTIGLCTSYYFYGQDRLKKNSSDQNENGNQSIQKVGGIFSLQSPAPDYERDLIINQDSVVEQKQDQAQKHPIHENVSPNLTETLNKQIYNIRSNGRQRSTSSNQQLQKKSKTEYKGEQSSKNFIMQDNNYFKELFNQLPNGIMVLGQDEKLSYINNSFCEIMGSESKIECKSRFLSLQNCQKEFKEEENYQNIFKAFDQRLRNFKVQKSSLLDNSFGEDYSEDQDENEFENIIQSRDEIDLSLNINIEKYLSQSQDVREEYIKNIQSLNKYIQKQIQKQDEGLMSSKHIQIKNCDSDNTRRIYGKIKFFSETKLFCRFVQKEYEEENQENFQQQEDIVQIQSVKSQNNETNQKIFEVTFIPFIHGQKTFVLILISDVTMFNQLTVLQQINKNKTNMLYQVSHELRTPLNSILLLSEKLMEKYSNNQDIEEYYLFFIYIIYDILSFYEPIYTATSQLINLINDQLDIAQLNAGKFKIVYQEFNLQEFIDKIFKIMKPQVVMRQLSLKYNQGENIPYTLVSDPNRIRQILLNLMSNSLKFTQVGGITLSITKAGFSVQDTGLGIEISNQQTLFQAFGKLTDTQNMNSQGVGLGLMISHTIAQQISKQQGVIVKQSHIDGKGLTVKSDGIGKGSEFYFYVYDNFENQRQKSNTTSKMRRSSLWERSKSFKDQKGKFIQIEQAHQNVGEFYDSSPKDLAGDDNQKSRYNFKSCSCKEILIIDDEPFNIRSLSTLLRDYDLKIQQVKKQILAINFNEVSAFLNQLIFSKDCCNWIRIILMDLEMPQKNGFEVTSYIRKMEQDLKQRNKYFRSCVIIACSGHRKDQMQDQCSKQGMDYYLEKPISKKLLLDIISKQISEFHAV